MPTVLITCAASQVIPTAIKMIRSYDDAHVRVVGTDIQPKDLSVGAIFCDNFYQVPPGNDTTYCEAISHIVGRENVCLIFPGSDEEAIALSGIKDHLFKVHDCHVACSNLQTTLLASNKFDMLAKFSQAGLHTAQYSLLNTTADLVNFAALVDYPTNPFIIKPKIASGSRGFKIVRDDISEKARFFSSANIIYKLPELVDFFRIYPEEITKYFAMEYFPGDKYSSDLLFEKGTLKAIVTRSNGSIPKTNPPTQLADIEYHADITDYIRHMASLFEFDFFVQIETGRDSKGKIAYIESNPRLDASLAITEGIGINYYHHMLNYALHGTYGPIAYDNITTKLRFFRFWDHAFAEPNTKLP